MLLQPQKRNEFPGITVTTSNKKNRQEVKGRQLKNGWQEYFLGGNRKVNIKWQEVRPASKKKLKTA
jgi:hypothetical protein